MPSPDRPAPLPTRWTEQAKVETPHPEYPRPQLRRAAWTNLNGAWEFAISTGDERPEVFDRRILVPFPVESHLSGIEERVPEGRSVWYRRTFARPDGARTILRFEACDWHTQAWVNGRLVGEHFGGYDPFAFDVTAALAGPGPQELVVKASDPTDAGPQPRGKQVDRPRGIYYTPTTGIWQTVWLEPAPATFVSRLVVRASNDGLVRLRLVFDGPARVSSAEVSVDGGPARVVALDGDGAGELRIERPRLWSPEHPNLVRLSLRAGEDAFESYFAFREVSVAAGPDGTPRLCLNGRPCFMLGTLDQGFWPDGLYTAPTLEAMVFDIDQTKALGFNTIRKHVKVEPRTWYAHCDKVGVLVWQDMPSGDRDIAPEDPDLVRTPESAAAFERELDAMVENLESVPCIVAWALFNEGWGQFDTVRQTERLRARDSSRLIDATTGWCDRAVGDMHDLHAYPGPTMPPLEAGRCAVLGEFGGIGLATPGHMWAGDGWGYATFDSREALAAKFQELLAQVAELKRKGLCAAIYTQTTDVETEANGLLTYDREVLKLDAALIRRATLALID